MFVLLFCCTIVSSVSAQIDDEIVKVEASLVVLNASIMDRDGRAVTGLKRPHFRIFEDGVEQEILMFEAEETPFAAVILIDSSGSMEDRIVLARSAAIQFIQGMRPGDVAAIYNFASKLELVQEFSNDGFVREQVFELKSRGMTVLNDAVYKAAEELSGRPEKRKAILVISDGADTMSRRSSDQALKAALAANATIYTVDMSSFNTGQSDRMQNQAVLKNFAEKSGGRFISTPGGVAMRDAFKRIVEELRVQYTLAYQPSNTKTDGKWRAIELRISKPALSIRTRKGYNAPKRK